MEETLNFDIEDYHNEDFLKVFENEDDNNHELRHSIEKYAFEYLCQNESRSKNIDSEKTLSLLQCLRFNSMVSNTFSELKPETQLKFIQLTRDLLQDLLEILKEKLNTYNDVSEIKDIEKNNIQIKENLEFSLEESDEPKTVDLNIDIIIDILIDIKSILVNYTYKSNIFSEILTQNNVLKILFDYFSLIIDKVSILQSANTSLHKLAGCVCKVIFYLSKHKYRFIQEWEEVNAVDILFNYANKIKDNQNLSEIFLIINATISFIFAEKDLNKTENIDTVIKYFINLVKSCADMAKNRKEERIEFQQDENEINAVKPVICEGWNIIEILKCLNYLSVSDSIKIDIYFKFKAKDYLRNLIYYGNEIEKNYALKLLWKLCFKKEVAEDIKNDLKLYQIIKQINDSKETKELIQSCNGMIWLMDEKSKLHTTELIPKVESKSKHIMISYNSKSREMCLKIKNALELKGYSVWIDLENIHGSSLESMANAIEESSCILICMTERYKQSANCRLEAEYSISKNKLIVPLILERAFKPDGWLGLISGSKILIDFTQYDFEECFERLQKEIVQFFDSKVGQIEPKGSDLLDVVSQSTLQPLKFSEKEIENWIYERKIIKEISETLLPCDGELLYEIYQFYQKIPEYFYSSLNPNKTLKLRDIAHFTKELKTLFK